MKLNKAHNIALVSALCLLLCSCQGKVDPEFTGSSTVGLQVNGNVLFEYDPLTWQSAFNRESREFRMHTDNMSDYYCLSLNLVPTEVGQKAKGNIIWTSRSSISSRTGISFTVERMDRSGKLWLWCKKEKLGVTVQVLDQ